MTIGWLAVTVMPQRILRDICALVISSDEYRRGWTDMRSLCARLEGIGSLPGYPVKSFIMAPRLSTVAPRSIGLGSMTFGVPSAFIALGTAICGE